jgi:SAM-dependent MidA family methyltransferase
MKGINKLLEKAIHDACRDAPISFFDFIERALYSPELGYYTRHKTRIGRNSQQDFYTAESLGKVFAQCVSTAAVDLLGPEKAAESTLIEIAAEPGKSLIDALNEIPFADCKTIRQGEPITAEGPVILFANEWLDALPFHRIIYHQGAWRERGVRLNPANNQLEETLLARLSAPVQAVSHRLPKTIEEGYEIDLPLAAESALEALLSQDWHGLILFFDYGKTWTSLCQDSPSGTARTFQNHQRGNDLLDQPGEKDITCEICWDWHHEQLKAHRFNPVYLESQESFIVHRAARAAEAIVCNTAGAFSPDRQTLMELIHPAHMGQRFQVLWGIR